MTQEKRDEEKKRLYELIVQSYTSNRSKWEVELFNEYMRKHEIPRLVDDLLDGGVIVPPCKVGDTVFDIGGFPKIMEAEVETMTTDGQEMSSVVVNKSHPFHRWFVNWKDAGIFVFFDRKEAKRALKERGE